MPPSENEAAGAERSRSLEATLSEHDLHDQWEDDYRTPQSRAFFDAAFDRLVALFGDARPGDLVLDAGCGAGAHTIRLVRRGLRVHAVDFSETVLAEARRNVASENLEDRVRFSREDLLGLSFPDGSFRFVVCWGVLMHIAEIRKAVSELARVLAPGGRLAVSEINARSLQRLAFVGATGLLGKKRARETRTPAGMECWFETPGGLFLRRHTDIAWLTRAFEEEGLRLVVRLPGQFTELYLKTRSPLAKAWIHRWNAFWFRRVRDPRLAFGNILVFERPLVPGSASLDVGSGPA